jgi:hypothetical protein
MSAKGEKVYECLEALFKRLDAAKLAPVSILANEAQKEHYESTLMFAFRKLQAARYHRQQVDRLIEVQAKELDRFHAKFEPKSNKLTITSSTARISGSANEFIFELSAFFAAIRSGIDFLAMASSQHLKGVQANSITTLLGLIKKGKTGPILDEIAEDAEWLIALRDYRDYLVHRLVISTTSGRQVQWTHGSAATTQYPIVVPAETPKHVPDTRRARAYDEPEHRFNVASSQASVTYSDGTKHLIEHSVEMEPSSGYIRIEDLMKRELTAFEHFFVKIVGALTKLDFAPSPLEAGTPKKLA